MNHTFAFTRCLLALALAWSLATCQHAHAADVTFKDLDGPNDLTLDSNWNGEFAPTSSDRAFINTSTNVGDFAYLATDFEVLNLTLANLVGEAGRVDLRSGGNLTLTGVANGADRVASLGRNGLGTVNLLTGSSLALTSGDVRLGENNGATGNLVQQAGTSFDIGGSLAIGMFAGGTGTYTMEGGTLDVATFMIVGRQGTGNFLQSGGDITVNRNDNVTQPALFLGSHAGSTSLYEISGGSLSIVEATNAGLQIGIAAGTVDATLRVIGGDASIDIATNLTHNVGGTLNYVIDSSISSIDVVGNVTLAGLLQIDFASQPQVGDQFTLINYEGNLAGQFETNLLANSPLGPVSYRLDYGSGVGGAVVLTVIPEPASVVLLGGLLGGCLLWRRSCRR